MNLKITGHHLDVTDPIRDYIQTKLKRLTRHVEDVLASQVTLSVEHDTHCAEATLHVRSHHLHAHAKHSDMYAAIDLLAGKLDRQLLKYKEKRKDHHQDQVTHHQLG